MAQQNQQPDNGTVATVRDLVGKADTAQLFDLIHQEKRRANHVRAKASQPHLGLAIPPQLWAAIKSEMLKPFTEEEAGQSGFDYLCQTVRDCTFADDPEDTLFALIRAWRRAWAVQVHLGPIELKGQTK